MRAGSRTASLDAAYVSGTNVTAIVELAFGQIKQGRGFRQFLFRVMPKLRGDWALIVHHRLARTSSPHRGLDRPRYKASYASASCGCHAESLLIEGECGSREGARRVQSHVEEGQGLGLRTEWKRPHGPRTVGTSRIVGRRPASHFCVRKTWRNRRRTTNNEGTLSHSFNAGDSRTVTQRSHTERKHSVARRRHKGITSVGTKPIFLPGRPGLYSRAWSERSPRLGPCSGQSTS
jgi:hypothetical protein